uniref:Uncharacterized protein n=1 Tax=Plectus sambesii TaxID=2011161 RepID=A0A914V8B0_9BILA
QLEQHCAKQNLGQPVYEPVTLLTKDGGGRDLQLFVVKVTIPGLVDSYGPFQPQQPYLDMEQAQEYGALFVLNQLGLCQQQFLPHFANIPMMPMVPPV